MIIFKITLQKIYSQIYSHPEVCPTFLYMKYSIIFLNTAFAFTIK